MGIPDHLTCPLSNLYAGQEATVRTGHGTTPSGDFLDPGIELASPALAGEFLTTEPPEPPGKGEGNGTPLQYSCLENSMDRIAW